LAAYGEPEVPYSVSVWSAPLDQPLSRVLGDKDQFLEVSTYF